MRDDLIAEEYTAVYAAGDADDGAHTSAQAYMNLMAEVLQVLDSASDYQMYLLGAVKGKSEIESYVKGAFDRAKGQSLYDFFHIIHDLLAETKEKSAEVKYTCAASVCLYMDRHICYSDIPAASEGIWDGKKMSLHSLLPIQTARQPVVIFSLNSNYRQTGICITPKFPVSGASMPGDFGPPSRKLSTRNALYGLNGKLVNVGYYPWKKDKTPSVRHIILPERLSQERGEAIPEETRIAFSPLTDRQDVLKTRVSESLKISDFLCNALTVDGISDPKHIEQRFENSWLAACQFSPDVFFVPEMLATDEMVCIEDVGSRFLRPLLKKAAWNGWDAPRITVMPTHWRDGRNRLFLFDALGNLLGTQYKQVPYVDEKNGLAEAIEKPPDTDVLLIHLENQQRIAFAICAEFLAKPQFIRGFLCEKLGATLILVPSYTRGEQDFVDTLPILKPYGTSVIWGNCCGAVPGCAGQPARRIIGGCNYAGMDGQNRFGSESKCGFRCGEGKICFFASGIPTNIRWQKPDSPRTPRISHIYA